MTEQPNIILLSIDALRADHLGSHGYERETSPFLDDLASRELEFKTAISASSHTREAVPALLSGKYPDVFAANGYHYVPETVADRLSAAGFQTAGFHSNPYVSRAYGYDSGFDTFDDDLVLGQNRLVALAQRALDKFLLNKGNYHARAEEINSRSLSWLDSRNNDQPFFLWNHYMDPHGPYNPPERFSFGEQLLSNNEAQYLYQKTINNPSAVTNAEHRNLIDSYDGEIRYLDDQLSAFFDVLKEQGLVKESLIIVTADHGDAFGEHGYFTHPRHLHETLLHVPLLVSPPGNSTDKTIKFPVSTLDIVPTFLKFARVEYEELPNESLIDMDGATIKERPNVVFASATGEDADEGLRRFAGRTKTKKVVIERKIEDGSIQNEQSFDLNSDPDEQKPAEELDEELLELRNRVVSFSTDRLGAVGNDAQTYPDNPEVEERLEALGYK
jgi:arylsulfatase